MSRPAAIDSAFYTIRRYVGSDGERVVLEPGTGTRWLYRFPDDRRWRVSKDKFHALLHAAWELGKSGAKMAWEPEVQQRKSRTRFGFIQTHLNKMKSA